MDNWNNVGNPGCHQQLPLGDGWFIPCEHGDDLGMVSEIGLIT